jgi:hypothetical protein
MKYVLLLIALIIIMAIDQGVHGQQSPSVLTPAAADTYAHTVYISAQSSTSASPAGTQASPYDGSTPAKLDAVIASIPADTQINFGPGTFQTNAGIVMKDHWAIQGAGMYLTTIQATAAKIQTSSYIITANNLPSPLVVQDIGIDGNFANPAAGAWSIAAIGLGVAKATVQRCYIRNCSCNAINSTGGNPEMFVVYLGPSDFTAPAAGWGIAQDNRIENCTSINGAYLDGIAISGGWTGYTGQIENNVFRKSASSTGSDIAWNLLWCDTGYVSNNISFGGVFNSDFGGTNSLVIANNTFLAIKGQNALQVGGGSVSPQVYPLATNRWLGVVVENNFFELIGGAYQAGLQIHGGVINAVVQNNIFRGDATNKYILTQNSDNGTGTSVLFTGNLVDNTLVGSSVAWTGNIVTLTGNYWFDGTPFPTP